MSLLDTFAPRRGSKQQRFGKIFIAKTSFYLAVLFSSIFVLTSFVLFDKDRELAVIHATRVESEILKPVQDYLKAINVSDYEDMTIEVNCWSKFEGTEFNVEYLDRGSWRVDAFYKLVRYYWRVDDVTLEVTRDPWNRSTHPTIIC